MRLTPRLAVVGELGSDLWPPVSFSEPANLQRLLSRLQGCPFPTGPEAQEGGGQEGGGDSTRPDQVT